MKARDSRAADSEDDDIATWVADYLAHCRARGLSPKTVNDAYGYPLQSVLLPFCAQHGIVHLADLSRRALDRLTSGLLEHGGKKGQLSKHSVHAYMRAVNHFLRWASSQGQSVSSLSQLPKLPKKLVEVLSREEIGRLEAAAATERDKLIIRLLADSGIRVGELTGLRLSDLVEIDRNGYVKVKGKGAKDRLVPVPRLYRRLKRYAEHGRPLDCRSDRLFVALRRPPGGADHEPLTSSGVGQMLRALAQQAGVTKRVYPHLLRHSYATWALSKGVNPITLAQILGHSSLAMIQNVYAHLSPQDSFEAMAKALLADE